MAPNEAGSFFPTNPDLADILGDTDFDLIVVIFWICWIPNLLISRPPDFHPRLPDFQIHKTYFEEFSSRFFDMSSAIGYVRERYFQEVGLRCYACYVPKVACHGVQYRSCQ